MAILNNNPLIGSGGQQGYSINNSLRFRSSASARLSRTFGTTGTNNKIQTFSAWVKRGRLSSSTDIRLMGGYNGSASWSTEINFFNDTLRIEFGGSAQYSLVTTQLFRDPSAWYHIVIAIDTTQATASNRVRMYVNGTQITAFSTANYPAQNDSSQLTSANANNSIGAGWSGFDYFDGYMADINFIDGQAKTPSDFGETDTTTGVWKPKAYTGTYGTNGFYLKFSDIATTSGSNAGLGKDFSGNSNYWTTNNISVTSGTTYDAMTDSPTNTSATVGNYCTLNSTIKISSGSITEGNLKGAGSDFEGWGTIAFPSTGKFYFEYTQNGSTGAGAGPGTGIQGINPPDVDYGVHYHRDGRKWVNGTYSSYGATFTTNDIIGVAYDADSNSITFYKNNVSQGAISTTSGYTYLPYQFDNSGNGGFLNFGQRPFAYTPPTGYVALNTYNLPTPTILQGNKYMDATVYSGNSTSGRLITNAALFQPDFVWVKNRTLAGRNNQLFDSVRGANKGLFSNLTNAESTTTQDITAFNSNGFTVGNDNNVNSTGDNFVGWQWQAGQGTNTTNTSGSITSTVSVNTTAGFSIVTYTGTGANATVGHGLGVAPRMIIFKQRNAVRGWIVYHASLANASTVIYLNVTNAASTDTTAFNATAPTSSVFSVGTSADTNQSTGTYVAYCWADVSGYSRAFSYTGNGSTDGPMVYLGLKPKFVMIKRTDSTGEWLMFDTSRSTYNQVKDTLLANSSGAEFSYSGGPDFLSNGIKIRGSGTNTDINANGGTYVGMAFASNPFKSSNAV